MNVKRVIALTTFAGAAVTCGTLGVTYPIAIWVAGFVALTKKQHQASHAECPLVQAAAARERGEQRVRIHG